MKQPASEDLMKAGLLVGCIYEVVAILSGGRVPTITRLLRTWGSRHSVGKMTVWLWCGYISWHFLEPLDDR